MSKVTKILAFLYVGILIFLSGAVGVMFSLAVNKQLDVEVSHWYFFLVGTLIGSIYIYRIGFKKKKEVRNG